MRSKKETVLVRKDTQGRIANQLCRPRQDLRGSPHLLSLERIWYYIKVLTYCQCFYIHFSPEFPQIREGARGNLRFPRFFRRQRKKNIKSFLSGYALDKNTLTCASRDAHTSDRCHWWWGATAQPLATPLLYGCGVPLAGKGGACSPFKVLRPASQC